jgi:hypothetical protein
MTVEFIGLPCWRFQWFARDFSAWREATIGALASIRRLERMTAFHRGCVKTQMRDRRMVGQLAVFDCRILTDVLRSMSF